jgi:hypothetical protein
LVSILPSLDSIWKRINKNPLAFPENIETFTRVFGVILLHEEMHRTLNSIKEPVASEKFDSLWIKCLEQLVTECYR